MLAWRYVSLLNLFLLHEFHNEFYTSGITVSYIPSHQLGPTDAPRYEQRASILRSFFDLNTICPMGITPCITEDYITLLVAGRCADRNKPTRQKLDTDALV